MVLVESHNSGFKRPMDKSLGTIFSIYDLGVSSIVLVKSCKSEFYGPMDKLLGTRLMTYDLGDEYNILRSNENCNCDLQQGQEA